MSVTLYGIMVTIDVDFIADITVLPKNWINFLMQKKIFEAALKKFPKTE